MSGSRPAHVYILGAGRSGTTLLSVLLGAHPGLRARGELLHFPFYWLQDRRCSCGRNLRQCACWSAAGHVLGSDDAEAVQTRMGMLKREETHLRAVGYLLGSSQASREYLSIQETLFASLTEGAGVVDESKYVARALALATLERQPFRFIYLVRDCRGVLSSFAKMVQKPRSMLSAAIYYCSVNAAAQIAVWTRLRGRAIKVRYEDLIHEPQRELARIGQFLGLDMSDVIERVSRKEPIDVGHLVSGNRLRSKGAVTVHSNEEWRTSYGLARRLAAYALCLPLQLLNRYRP